jgi:4-amino-4-deoxy-L-arabinose transferase-like glycosyltransferase
MNKICAVSIIVLYMVLRLGWPETIEFGYDQPKYAMQTLNFIDHGTFLTSHEFNDITPFGNFSWGSSLIFLFTPFFLISTNVILVSQLIAVFNALSVVLVIYIGWRYFSPLTGLVAGLFLAVQPWWVVFSRMIYSPSMGPSWVALCMLLTFMVVKQAKSYAISFLLMLWGVLAHIYLSHFSTIVVSALGAAVAMWRGFRVLPILLGIALLAFLYTPTVYYYYNHPQMFGAYFGASNRFNTDNQSLSERFTVLGLSFISALAGGGFKFQLGYMSETFDQSLQSMRYFPLVILVLVIATLVYSVGKLIFLRRDELIFRVLLLLWATGPVWFMILVRVPEIVPRYFLLCMPAFSLLFGLFISEIINYVNFSIIRYVFLSFVVCVLFYWAYFITEYYNFVATTAYPNGFLSYFSDPPYVFLDKSMQWMLADAREKGYGQVVVSNDPKRPHEYIFTTAMHYYWEYYLKNNTKILPDANIGYYQMYYSPLRVENEGKSYQQFGPYIVFDNTQ